MVKAKTQKPETLVLSRDEDESTLKHIGGSRSEDWNQVLIGQAVNALWLKNSDDDQRLRQQKASIAALSGIAPNDETESMIAAQLIASHNAAMECYRRAMIGEQSFEGRRENLNQANKLSRTWTTLLEALNRHRGKGQQKVTVEHVHVHAGAQAIVGSVEAGGRASIPEELPHAIRAIPIPHAPGATLPSQIEEHETPVPIAGSPRL